MRHTKGCCGCQPAELQPAQQWGDGEWTWISAKKRKILLIFHSVGAEAMGDWQAACERQWVTRGQVSLREQAEANTRNEHSCLKPAELIHQDALFYPAVRTQLREPLSERRSFWLPDAQEPGWQL